MISLLIKEINGFLNSLIAYIVVAVFLIGMGLLVWVFPETSVLEYGYAEMDAFFSLAPYVFLFLIPAITMRSFSEESKSGTLELLLTKPLGNFQVILGKYLAGILLVAFALVPTLIYYWSIYQLGNPPGNLDSAGVVGSYLGLALLGAVYTAIGIFASSLSENQIVSFVIALFLCFFWFSGFGSIAAIDVWGKYSNQLNQAGLLYHYNSLGKGLIDSRNLVYLFSIILGLLLSTNLVLTIKRW